MNQLPLFKDTDARLIEQVKIMAQMYQDGRISFSTYKAFVQSTAALLKHRQMSN